MFTQIRNTLHTYRQEIFLFTLASPWVYSSVQKARGRDRSTLADLSLHGRLENVDFKSWLENIEGKEAVEYAQKKPRAFIVLNQLGSELFAKAIIPTIYVISNYLSPTNPSLIHALKILLSNSERASKVALPILEKIASNSRLSPLFNMHVILWAPLVVKLVHMALLYQNPDTKSLVNRTANRLSQGFEIISHASYSLHSLSISTTLYRSVAKVAYDYGVKCLVKTVTPVLKEQLQLTPEEIKLQKPNLISLLSLPFLFLSAPDLAATAKISMGFYALRTSFQTSSDPHDGEKLHSLFDSINEFNTNSTTDTVACKSLMDQIDASLKSDAISKKHARALRMLLSKPHYEQRAQEALQLELEEIPARFEQIMKDLKELSFKISPEQLSELKVIVKEQLKKYWQNLAEPIDSTNLYYLAISNISLPTAVNIYESYAVNKIFGHDGIFTQFITDPDDYFVPLEYHYHLFNDELELGLNNPEKMSESRLQALLKLAQIDRETFVQTQVYSRTLPTGTVVNEITISLAIAVAPELAYRKTAPKIPADFKFQNKDLAEAIAKLRQEVDAPASTIPNLSLYG